MTAGSGMIVAICVAEVLTMIGVFAFPALLPVFLSEWSLTKTEAGWIAGIYFVGYAAGAPILVALTDRIDARRVYIGGAIVAAASCGGFALFADGFWPALVLRLMAGIALAATYMPGLKVLVDRYQGARQSRAVAIYTSSFSLGTAVSFLVTGEAANAFGWRWAFAAAAVAAIGAAVIGWGLRAVTPEPTETPSRLLDFRPVLTNRVAMAYILGYGVHCWELFTLRSWMVALLAFNLTLDPQLDPWPSPTMAAMLSGLVAMAASVGGNELCVRFGRRSIVQLVMALSALMACAIGFATQLSYAVLVIFALAYSAAVQLDSAALTAGAVAAAQPKRQGATMAVHSLIGFTGASIGPLVLGAVLDLSGGGVTVVSWGLAFVSVGLVGAFGPLALRLASRD